MKTKHAPKIKTPDSAVPSHDAESRFQQLSDIARDGEEDNAACALADLNREFPATS